MTEITLNKKKYLVNNEEFPIYDHPQYTSILLRPKVGVLEKEIGLINDLNEIFNLNFINLGIKDGGFLPLEINIKNRSILARKSEVDDLYNFNQNMIEHQQNIELIDEISDFDPEQYYLLRVDYSFITLSEKEYQKIIEKQNVIIIEHQEFKLDKFEKYSKNYQNYHLENSDLNLYVPDKMDQKFKEDFRYYFTDDGKFVYDNLINLCIMVKNAGNEFRQVLEKNLPYVDRWTFLDTGSTDNTIKIIKDVMKDKKGKLYCEPFINFRDSRNRCLDLAGKSCKFNIMLDDTYTLQGNVRDFLTLIRSDQFATSYNIFIKSPDITYGSNRITRSEDELRYMYRIHEIIQEKDNKLVVQIPFDQMWVHDYTNSYMNERTRNRNEMDIKLLEDEIRENPDNPRHLYYLAQTYIGIRKWDKAVEYYQKRTEHSVEGYREEVTDSYLLTAFYGHTELGWEWPKCEKIYLKCFHHEPSRADALYFIGLYYVDKDNYLAYQYLKRAFDIGIPTTVTSNLRPDLYNRYLPESLIPLCYQFKDYELGWKVCDRLLNYVREINHPLTVSYYNIFKLMSQNRKMFRNVGQKPILTFVADGGFNKWQGSSLNRIGVGGSETYIIEMSRHIARITNFDVYVFCNCEEEELFEGVQYRKLETYVEFINSNKVDTSIISRFSEYTHVSLANEINNIYLVVHDLLPSGNIVPTDKRLRAIFCMSEWHKSFFLQTYPMLEHKVKVFPNGINLQDYQSSQDKKLGSFIYSSFPNRGLINLLKMFPKIRKRLPDATLDIFCDIKGNFVQNIAKEEMDEIERLLDTQKEFVTNHGWVRKEELQKYWQKAEFWLYPCTFMETFCITALEAAASRTLAITNNLAALQNTVGDRGLVVEVDTVDSARSEKWQDTVIDQLMELIEDKGRMDELLDKNQEWSKEYDWSKLGERMVDDYLGNRININEKHINEKHIESEECSINFNIKLYDNEYISDFIRTYGFWELYTSSILIEIFELNPDILLVDIGANIGYYSLLAASKNIDVISFEPIKSNYELFESSIVKNNFDNRIKLYKKALSNNNEELTFNIYESNMGLCSTEDYDNNIIKYKENVICCKLDEYINEINNRKVVIKIDVEKMELNVLLGMEKLFEKDIVKYIVIELSDNISQVCEIMRKYGFLYFYNIGFDRDYNKNMKLTSTSYLTDEKYINKIDKLLDMEDGQKNLLFCKTDSLVKYKIYKIDKILSNSIDSSEYNILINAVKNIKNVPGITVEIGVREGGSSYLIMKTLLENNDKRDSHLGLDPYGNIDYTHWENVTQKLGYTNDMKNRMMKNIYKWCEINDFNFILLPLEDTEYFKRFTDGLPIYNENKKICNEYSLVFFDGPHSVNDIKTEINFFKDRTPLNGVWVFDDIDQYPHMEKLDEYIRSFGFNILEIGLKKVSYQRNKLL